MLYRSDSEPSLHQPLQARIAVQFSILGIASVVSWLLGVASLSYTGRVLGAEAFGLLNFATVVVSYLSVLINPGMTIWGVRDIARNPLRAKGTFVAVTGTRLALAGTTYLGLLVVSYTIMSGGEAKILRSAGLALFGLAIAVQWVCQGLERYALISLSQVLTQGIALALIVVCVSTPHDVYWVPVLGFLGQVVTSFAILSILVLTDTRWRESTLKISAKRAITESMPLGVSAILITILHYANSLFIYLFHGSRELGLFSGPFRLIELLALIPSILTTVFLPRISRVIGTDMALARSELRFFVKIVIYLAGIVALTLVFEGQFIIRLMFGEGYDEATLVIRVLGICVFSNFAAIVYTMALISIGADRDYFRAILAGLIVSVIGGLIAVPLWGKEAAAFVVGLGDLITALTAMWGVRQKFGEAFISSWYVTAVASALCGTWFIVVDGILNPLTKILGGAMLYFVIAASDRDMRRLWRQ